MYYHMKKLLNMIKGLLFNFSFILLWKKYFYICRSEKPAGFSDPLFHGKGRNGKQHLLALAPLRGAAAAAAEGPSNRRNEKNAFSEAASIFPLRLLLWDY